ncbi:hypothetical protein TRICI_001603 [Trichomonascus ciferrii]|uniref:AB hydrolase-1 domain-containing protein n=1 Tax=Trichomonascus ciferrii TaxID=44093 RepID=A0A642V8W5_9ASCO|nr:hypothetical protein TRICI_001603 [Trichomonascus ciferrii]
MPLEKRTETIEAHYPRQTPWGTMRPEDRLKIVYNVYTPPDNKQTGEYPINLVFVHGTGMCKELWEDMIERFFQEFDGPIGKVISVDAATHGESALLNEGSLGWAQPWTDGARDIVKLVRETIPYGSGPTILVGHSMGGAQCVHAAFFAPAEIDAIAVVDPVSYTPDELMTEQGAREFIAKRMGKVRKGIRETFTDYDDYESFMKTRYLSQGFAPRILDDFIKHGAEKQPDGTYRFKTTPEQQMIGYYSALYTILHDFTISLLRQLSCPVLHLAGTNSTFNYPGAIDVFRDNMPKGCEYVDIEDGTHLVPFEKPEETFKGILPFISKSYEQAVEKLKETDKRRNLSKQDADKLFKQMYEETAKSYPIHKRYSKL